MVVRRNSDTSSKDLIRNCEENCKRWVLRNHVIRDGIWHGHVCTTFVKQISLDRQATITLLCMSHLQGRPSWNPTLSWKSPLSSQNLDTSLPSEMPPCHHSWFPPIVSGSENQFLKRKKKKKPISQNRAWIIDDNMLLWCCFEILPGQQQTNYSGCYSINVN